MAAVTIALTRHTFVSKVMFLLFNMLSRFVIAFLPRNKRVLISWLQSPSAVILEPPKIKSGSRQDVYKSLVLGISVVPDGLPVCGSDSELRWIQISVLA